MTPPYDLTPLLEQAPAETWLEAVKLWRRKQREISDTIGSIVAAEMVIAIIAALIMPSAKTAKVIRTAGVDLAKVIETAIKPV